MKLRSGIESSIEGPCRLVKNIQALQKKLNTCNNHSNNKSIKSLKYILRLYTKMDETFYEIYTYRGRDKITDLNLTTYKKTLELMCQLIGKTYTKKAEDYDKYEKELIVKTLYKMHIIFIKLQDVLLDLEYESTYMKELLRVCEKNAGKLIKDKESKEALAYYCYSHLYGSNNLNRYNMNTYEDGEYSYEEIYDNYYGENINNNIKDDVFIEEDYKRWFIYENSHYHKNGYTRYTELPPLYDYEELRARISHHSRELERYKNEMSNMYPYGEK